MNLCFNLDQEQEQAFWSIVVVTISFLIYHFISNFSSFHNNVAKYFGKKKAKISVIIIQRLLGVFTFGIIPLVITFFFCNSSLYRIGLNIDNLNTSLIWIFILSPIILLMNYFNSKKEDNLAMYPQIRKKKWTKALVTLSALSWITYLFAYEFMFRGFLLFNCYHALGAELAIAINICIYSLVHVPKGLKEAIGAIPLGIILCILTIKTNSMFIAIAVHIVMALSNEWFSIKANPKMRIV